MQAGGKVLGQESKASSDSPGSPPFISLGGLCHMTTSSWKGRFKMFFKLSTMLPEQSQCLLVKKKGKVSIGSI